MKKISLKNFGKLKKEYFGLPYPEIELQVKARTLLHDDTKEYLTWFHGKNKYLGYSPSELIKKGYAKSLYVWIEERLKNKKPI